MAESIRVLRVGTTGDPGQIESLERADDRITVATATGAAEALDHIDRGDVDCVVSDYDLRDGDGIEFLEAVREDYPDLPFVLYTDRGSETLASEAVAAGVTDYVPDELASGDGSVLAERVIAAAEEGALERDESDPTGDGGDRDHTSRERLRRERDRLITLFENLPNPVVYGAIEDDGPVIERVNPAFEETFGYDAEEVVGENLDELTVPEDRRDEARSINERIVENGSIRTEIERRTADGLRDFVLDVVIRERDDDAPEGYAIYTDITERKRRERDLERQNERLDAFASVVSHDLRNPLEVATANLELALEDCDSPHLGSVADAHERMERLIDDVLALAREGETVQETVAVDLRSVAERSWRTVATAEASLDVEADYTLQADPDRLKQLLENLFRNCVEHGGDDVSITVDTFSDGFYVADDGPGIPEEEREQVFDSGYSTTEEGTGFGLSIVERIAEAHGWGVRVTESAAGGARFEVVVER